MLSGIYFIKNIITNKLYIGSSSNIVKRWDIHIKELDRNRHHNKYLQRAWNKYSDENFVFGVLEICSINILLDREQYYLDTYKNLYNINPNASKPPSAIGRKVEQKTREKLRNVQLGRKHTAETKRRLSIIKKEVFVSGKLSPRCNKFIGVLTSPDGTKYTDIPNLKQFCIDKCLSYSSIYQLISGYRKTNIYKGWEFINQQ